MLHLSLSSQSNTVPGIFRVHPSIINIFSFPQPLLIVFIFSLSIRWQWQACPWLCTALQLWCKQKQWATDLRFFTFNYGTFSWHLYAINILHISANLTLFIHKLIIHLNTVLFLIHRHHDAPKSLWRQQLNRSGLRPDATTSTGYGCNNVARWSPVTVFRRVSVALNCRNKGNIFYKPLKEVRMNLSEYKESFYSKL